MRKRLFSILLFLAIAGQALAKITLGPQGGLFRYELQGTTLECSKSIDFGKTFGTAIKLYTFTQEVNFLDLKFSQSGKPYFTYQISNESFFAFPDRNVLVKITSEAIFPKVAIDNFGKYHLVYLEKKPLIKLKYSTSTSLEASLEALTIFESYDEILNHFITFTPWGPAVAWQKGKETYLALSLDQGKSFSSPRQVFINENIEEFCYVGDKWFYFSPNKTGKNFSQKEIIFSPPTPPQIISPKDQAFFNSPTIEVIYQTGAEIPQICRVEFSSDINFSPEKTFSFEKLSTIFSPEVSYQIPIEIPEGTYFLRIFAFDGYASSSISSPRKIKIDRTPPTITIKLPSAEVCENKEIILEGEISEPASLSVNNQSVSLEASNEFKINLTLNPGNNQILLIATDEAKNTSTLQKNLYFASARPQLKVIKPNSTDWFKSGSTIYLEVLVEDLQNDIEDETEAEISILNQTLEEKLVYEKDSGKIYGFLLLPPNLPEGKLSAKISLRDSQGNLGETDFTLNLDHSPPSTILGEERISFSNNNNSFILPASDKQSGLDPQATIVKIIGKAQNILATNEGDALKIFFSSSLPDGTYEVEFLARDRVGNVATSETFRLILDTKPPLLELTSTSEAKSNIVVEGKAEDEFLSTVEIYNNSKKVESFIANGPFKKEISLFAGDNEIEIVAKDLAGNKSRQKIKIQTTLPLASAIIDDCQNGPNPFSPQTHGQMIFAFNLLNVADVKLYIFDLTGTLIWKREFKDLGAGYHNEINWDGKDHFGTPVNNGLYPYLIQAISGGNLEVRKGKIIILN